MYQSRHFPVSSIILTVLFICSCEPLFAHTSRSKVEVKVSPQTGALERITLEGDTMNWMLRPDGTQYAWIGPEYGWGLGSLTINGHARAWQRPKIVNGNSANYRLGTLEIAVDRQRQPDGALREVYTFTNRGDSPLRLGDIDIYTPFNDNYPGAETCLNGRCHAHIWAGNEGAWVCALRMGAQAPHLGLMLEKGSIDGYEIKERGDKKGGSHNRGVIALSPADLTLRPGQSHTIQWLLFAHQGKDDFRRQLTERGGIWVEAQGQRYVYALGDTARLAIHTPQGVDTLAVACDALGDRCVDIKAASRRTRAELLTVSNVDSLLARRASFITNHQRMRDHADPRYGALMVYDNEGDSIYPNDRPTCSNVDRDEGAERNGMGLFLEEYYRRHPSHSLKNILVDYYNFLRHGLQTPDYVTYSSVDQQNRNRGYNYLWIADYYFRMYELTGEKKYALDGYGTLMSWFRQFGHGFYAIDVPVLRSVKALRQAGLEAQADTLMEHFRATADQFVANSLNYPRFEVNYEQSIVAPALQLLCEVYLLTADERYLDEARRQLPVLEAFGGFQPSHHLCDVAIRHWDGHWFGKRQMYGDTFPHYWSCITAGVFHTWGKIASDPQYRERARNIVLNNLSLYTEDGRGSCAWVYPTRVNGQEAHFADPFSNDQDNALMFYYMVNP